MLICFMSRESVTSGNVRERLGVAGYTNKVAVDWRSVVSVTHLTELERLGEAGYTNKATVGGQ